MSYSRGNKYGQGRGRSYGGGAGRGFNRGSPSPKPVEVGKEYEVEITEISRQGTKWKGWKQHQSKSNSSRRQVCQSNNCCVSHLFIILVTVIIYSIGLYS